MVIKINKIFNSLDEVYECYGKENIVPITQLPQIIFYTSKWRVQPKWIEESEKIMDIYVVSFIKEKLRNAMKNG